MYQKHIHIMPDEQSLLNFVISSEDPKNKLLSELIDLECVVLEQSPSSISLCVKFIEKKYLAGHFSTKDKNQYICKLMEIVRVNSNIDYQSIFEEALELSPYPRSLRFADVCGVVIASKTRIDAYLTDKAPIIIDFLASKRGKINDNYFSLQIHDKETLMNYIRDQDISIHDDVIFVNTPKGEFVRLLNGSTIIDFAYKIHTNIGNCCSQAFVNDDEVSLDTVLNHGDQVNIIKGQENPNFEWHNFAKTSNAKRNIKHWHRTKNIERGKSLIEREFEGRYHLYGDVYHDIALKLGCENNVDNMFEKLGNGDLNINRVSQLVKHHIYSQLHQSRNIISEQENIPIKCINSTDADFTANDFMISHCCLPMPEQMIVGYYTKNSPLVRIHKSDCPEVMNISNNSLNKLEWNCKNCTVILKIIMVDREGLLQIIINEFKRNKIFNNIKSLIPSKAANGDRRSAAKIYILISSRKDLDNIKRELENIDDVYKVIVKGIYPGDWKYKND